MVHSCRSTLFLTERLTDQSAAPARPTEISFARSRDREKRRSQLLPSAAVIPRSSEEHGVIVAGNVSAGSNRSGRLAARLITVYSSASRDCIRLHSRTHRRAFHRWTINKRLDRAVGSDIGIHYDIQFDSIRASHP